ncbi:Positive regulator of Tartrate dehydrogenase/decarboxylase/D-malic enzyme [Nitrincola lacisaponensis]|uniref:Positive regulator of Tartrate dehydrogenase/decarboxylase/D-malic enzyme n=1 Tax=Nitrincola lacisaponensis TaxID=267850 RepID=A0A063Y1F9_9GAMM|nr:LysR substrate-binding domain-containing protein [Nitrincola lacisaponensis]KDE39499.1 Positive regulator of Tartrate dehydrogenase/decarboxylase/D-malic enzyme [Nitrincola lacisaponensis]
MNNQPSNDDLNVFRQVALRSSFAAAATDLGVSVAYVSKRIRTLEQVLNTQLLHRTTRRVSLTEPGEKVLRCAERILDDLEQLQEAVAQTRQRPGGTLRVSSSFGFGRCHVAPALASLAEAYPELSVRFEVFDRLVDVPGEGIDLDIRVGDDIAPHLIARKLADNHRILCAAPEYLAQQGEPRQLSELNRHECLVIKERDHPFGLWRLVSAKGEQQIRVQGRLSSNHGEVALQWALQGKGILLRSRWDVAPLIRSGQLRQVLCEFSQPASIWAVYPQRLAQSARVRAAVEHLQQWFIRHPPG